MKPSNRDYTNLNELAIKCGLVPTKTRGKYLVNGTISVEVDLSACAENENAILRTAMIQLAQKLEDYFFERKEKEELENL